MAEDDAPRSGTQDTGGGWSTESYTGDEPYTKPDAAVIEGVAREPAADPAAGSDLPSPSPEGVRKPHSATSRVSAVGGGDVYPGENPTSADPDAYRDESGADAGLSSKEDPPVAQPPRPQQPSRARRRRGRKVDARTRKAVTLAVLIVVVLLLAIGYRHIRSRHSAATSPVVALVPRSHAPARHTRVAKHSSPLTSVEAAASPSPSPGVPPALPKAVTSAVTLPKAPVTPQSAALAQPVSGSASAAQSQPQVAPTPPSAAVPSTPELRASLKDIKAQLATIETQMAELLKRGAGNDNAMVARLGARLGSLEALAHKANVGLNKLQSEQRASTPGSTLHGYRLVAVSGSQAVIKSLASGQVRVLHADQHFGDLVVYQVDGGQVVTNYGVF